MKTRPSFFRLLALGAIAAIVSTGTVASRAATPPARQARPLRLQVAVSMPASMNPIYADDVEETLADRIASSLHEQGFRGRISALRSSDDVAPDVPTLEVNLIEWRVDRMGTVDCTFSANLKTPNGQKNLGIFSGNSMLFMGSRDWFAREDNFNDAAHEAMADLFKRIQESNLLPEMPGKR